MALGDDERELERPAGGRDADDGASEEDDDRVAAPMFGGRAPVEKPDLIAHRIAEPQNDVAQAAAAAPADAGAEPAELTAQRYRNWLLSNRLRRLEQRGETSIAAPDMSETPVSEATAAPDADLATTQDADGRVRGGGG